MNLPSAASIPGSQIKKYRIYFTCLNFNKHRANRKGPVMLYLKQYISVSNTEIKHKVLQFCSQKKIQSCSISCKRILFSQEMFIKFELKLSIKS